MGMGLSYLVFQLVVLNLLEMYLPESKITKKLIRLTRRVKKVRQIRVGQTDLLEEYDSEQPDDSSSLYESEKESETSEVASPTAAI